MAVLICFKGGCLPCEPTSGLAPAQPHTRSGGRVRGGGLAGLYQGSQPLWISGKTLKMSLHFSSQKKLREFGGNTQNQGNSGTQEGKFFASLTYMYVLCGVSKLYPLTDWLWWLVSVYAV